MTIKKQRQSFNIFDASITTVIDMNHNQTYFFLQTMTIVIESTCSTNCQRD